MSLRLLAKTFNIKSVLGLRLNGNYPVTNMFSNIYSFFYKTFKLFICSFNLRFFTLNGYVKTYGVLYVELLDIYGKGPQETGMVATLFGSVLKIAGRCTKVIFFSF